MHKYLSWASLIFSFTLPILFFFQPDISPHLIIFTLIVALLSSIVSVTKNQLYAYRERKISRAIFAYNVVFEIFGILLAMTLAGLLGRYIAEIAT